MKKFQALTIILAIVLANLMFANLVLAQTTTPSPTPPTTPTASAGAQVSSQDIRQMEQQDGLIYQLKHSKGPNSPEYLQARQVGMQMCADLGNKLLAATTTSIQGKSSYSTLWGSQSDVCTFGVYVGKGTPTDTLGVAMKRNIIVQPDPPGTNGAANLYYEISNNTSTPLNPTAYAVLNAVTTDGVIGSIAIAGVDAAANAVLTTITNVITGAILSLTALAGELISVANTQTANGLLPDIVDTAWTIVRNILNMFFILALIIISLSIILRRENTGRKLLLNLILMALLINFSKVIATTLISASDAVMNLFISASKLNSYGQLFSGIVTNGNGISGIFYTSGANSISALAQGIAKLIVAVMITGGYLGIAGVIVVRLVGLWILIILSPAVFALSILPATKKYADQLREVFIKYLIWGPVIGFFLFLINMVIAAKGQGVLISSVADYILIGALMYGAIGFTRSSGIYGAKAVMDYAKTGAETAGKYIARGTPIRHAGVALEKATGGRVTGLKKFGAKIEQGTAMVEGLPGTIKAPFKRAGEKRDRQVEEESRMLQLRARMLPVNKDSAGKLSTREINYLASSGRLDEKTVSTIMEHGGKNQKNALRLAYADGRLENTEAQRVLIEETYRQAGGDMSLGLPRDYMLRTQTGVVNGKPTYDVNNFHITGNKVSDSEDNRKVHLVGVRQNPPAGQGQGQPQAQNPNQQGGRGSGRYQQPPGFGNPAGGPPPPNNPPGGNSSASTPVGNPPIPPTPPVPPTTPAPSGSSIPPSTPRNSSPSGAASTPPRRPPGFAPFPENQNKQTGSRQNISPNVDASSGRNQYSVPLQQPKVGSVQFGPSNEDQSGHGQSESSHATENFSTDDRSTDKLNQAANALNNSATAIRKAGDESARNIKEATQTLTQTAHERTEVSNNLNQRTVEELRNTSSRSSEKLGDVLRNIAPATQSQVRGVKEKLDKVGSDVSDIRQDLNSPKPAAPNPTESGNQNPGPSQDLNNLK